MIFQDKIAVIVAGGRSLAGFDFDQMRRDDVRVMAVKGSIFDLPWAACGFGLDTPRYEEWRERLAAEVTMPVYWAVPEPGAATMIAQKPACVRFVKRHPGVGLSRSPGEVYSGGSSGFGSLGMVYALGPPRGVILLGFDYRGEEKDGPVHHNEQHYIRPRKHSNGNWATWAAAFNVIAPRLKAAGVRVVNAFPESAINCFEKADTYAEAVARFYRV
jgi:hypothetical protein